jgi:hypothetical protein
VGLDPLYPDVVNGLGHLVHWIWIAYYTLFFHVLCYYVALSCRFVYIYVRVPDSGSSDVSYDQTVECGLEMYINSRGQVG